MSDRRKSNEQLVEELELARLRIAELESLFPHPESLDAFETEFRYKVISELTSDCCWVRWIDADGKTKRLWITESFARLTGYSPEEFDRIGRAGLIHPDDLEDALNHVSGPHGVSELDFRIIHKDGHVAWLRERMRVVPEKDALCIYGATWDITEEVEAKQEIKRVHQELEDKVLQRTRGLDQANQDLMKTQARLESALDEAREAGASLSRFFANMSHEIRTPLNGIIGTCHLLKSGGMELDQDLLNTLTSSAQILQTLIDDVMDISRIEQGDLVPLPSEFDPKQLVRELAHMFQFESAAKRTELDIAVSPRVPDTFCTDRRLLLHILINIMANAIKFTDQGRVRLKVRPRKDSLEFRVTDSGIGIAPTHIGHVFDPFYQVNPTAAITNRGAGLGLSISQRFAKLLGAEIKVRSRLGSYTSFAFRIGALEPSQAARAKRVVAPVERSLYRVLLAEDNPSNQLIGERILSRAGYPVHVVASGREVLENLAKNSYAVVLMDCQMPDMDGYEATQRIRVSKEPWRHIPIIAVTAHSFKEDRDRCFDLGMNAYITKPFDPQDLIGTIDEWIADPLLAATRESQLGASIKPKETVDLHRVREISGDDDEFAMTVIELYVENLAVRLRELSEAAARDERQLIQELAHSIKGSAGNIGAVDLQQEAEQLEMAIKSKATQIDKRLGRIQCKAEEVMQFFSQNPLRKNE